MVIKLIKLIIKKTHNNLYRGDIVYKRPGYSNYLINLGIAERYSLEYEAEQKLHLEDIEREKKEFNEKYANLCEELNNNMFRVVSGVHDSGQFYGSIKAPHILSAIQKKYTGEYKDLITKENIKLELPIKEVGIYNVKVQFGTDASGKSIETTINVNANFSEEMADRAEKDFYKKQSADKKEKEKIDEKKEEIEEKQETILGESK